MLLLLLLTDVIPTPRATLLLALIPLPFSRCGGQKG